MSVPKFQCARCGHRDSLDGVSVLRSGVSIACSKCHKFTIFTLLTVSEHADLQQSKQKLQMYKEALERNSWE